MVKFSEKRPAWRYEVKTVRYHLKFKKLKTQRNFAI